MDKLTCPCGVEIHKDVKMGITIYRHNKDKRLCPHLHTTCTNAIIDLNLQTNFKEFDNIVSFKKNLDGFSKEWFKESLKDIIGDVEKIKDYFEKHKKTIQQSDHNYVGIIIYHFGNQGEYILREIGITIDRVHPKSLNPIDLGIFGALLRSDYDKLMETTESIAIEHEAARRFIKEEF